MNLVEAGVVKQKAGDILGAEACYSAALAEDPLNHLAWQNLAVVAAYKDQLVSAVVMTEKAIQLDRSKQQALTYCNLGNMLWRMGKFDEARQSFITAEQQGLDDWRLHLNVGLLHMSLSEPNEAIISFAKAYVGAPEEEIEKLNLNLGYAHLMMGKYREGFQLVREGWTKPISPVCDLGIPQWNGEDLEGKSILVYHDQGAGDTILFSRFIKRLYTLGAKKVVLAVSQNLVRLFSKMGQQTYDILQSPPEQCDFITPISQLPYHLKITIDDLRAEFIHNNHKVTSYTDFEGLKIGLIWAARQDQETGPRRSIPLEQILPLALIPGARLYGLQVGPNQQDIRKLGAEHLINDMSPRIRDFLDLAHVMVDMDVIISADTAPLHLAGSMGIKTIGLLSYSAADWRWLDKERCDTPWYPTMVLVRQRSQKDWWEIVDQVSNILQHPVNRR